MSALECCQNAPSVLSIPLPHNCFTIFLRSGSIPKLSKASEHTISKFFGSMVLIVAMPKEVV